MNFFPALFSLWELFGIFNKPNTPREVGNPMGGNSPIKKCLHNYYTKTMHEIWDQPRLPHAFSCILPELLRSHEPLSTPNLQRRHQVVPWRDGHYIAMACLVSKPNMILIQILSMFSLFTSTAKREINIGNVPCPITLVSPSKSVSV